MAEDSSPSAPKGECVFGWHFEKHLATIMCSTHNRTFGDCSRAKDAEIATLRERAERAEADLAKMIQWQSLASSHLHQDTKIAIAEFIHAHPLKPALSEQGGGGA